MNRTELIEQSGVLAANLHELALQFELVQKAALDNRQPIDEPTLRTLGRIYQDASIRLEVIGRVTVRAFALLELHHPSVPSPAHPGGSAQGLWPSILRRIRGENRK